jgi:DNA-binding protein H-NS
MNLKSMSIDRLTSLRHRVESALSAKVIEQRRTLESELSKLTRFRGSKSTFGRGARGTVAAKYRNPENPSETWAGGGWPPPSKPARSWNALASPPRQKRGQQKSRARLANSDSGPAALRCVAPHSNLIMVGSNPPACTVSPVRLSSRAQANGDT